MWRLFKRPADCPVTLRPAAVRRVRGRAEAGGLGPVYWVRLEAAWPADAEFMAHRLHIESVLPGKTDREFRAGELRIVIAAWHVAALRGLVVDFGIDEITGESGFKIDNPLWLAGDNAVVAAHEAVRRAARAADA